MTDGQRITRTLKNDRPNRHQRHCACGGSFYALRSASYVRCTGGEMRCTTCHREARKFGRAFTCGTGCTPAA